MLDSPRRRPVAIEESELRRIARDLHDGLQGSLVLLSMQARRLAATEAAGGGLAGGPARDLAEGLDAAARLLRDLVDGVMPGPLADGGLAAAVGDLAAGMPLPVDVTVGRLAGPLPEAVETTAYFVVSEAFTNIAKHAGASRAWVVLRSADGVLSIDVSDDGHGGAGYGGSGLLGLRDRLAAVGGSLDVVSTVGGTRLEASIPCE